MLVGRILLAFGLFFCAVKSAVAGNYCSTTSIPQSEIVVEIDYGGCSLGQTEYITVSLNTVSQINACASLMYKNNKMPANRIAISASRNEDRCGMNAYVADTRHLSQFSNNRWICLSWYNKEDIKNFGYVITDYKKELTAYCEDFVYLKKLSPTSSREVICSDFSDVPPGWVVIRGGRNDSDHCLLSAYKEIVPLPQSGSIDICQLPADMTGYVYSILDTRSEQCNLGPLYRIGKAFDGALGCAVPSGMVAESVVESNVCPMGSAYKLTYPKDNLWMCIDSYTQAPPGFIVTASASVLEDEDLAKKCLRSQFGSGAVWKINNPTHGIVFCEGYGAIPAGFGVGDRQYRSQCHGYGRILTGIQDGVELCSLQALPDGYVYSKVERTNSCENLTFFVDQVGGAQNVPICYFGSISGPVPTGYVVTHRSGSASCEEGVPYTITPAGESSYSCDVSLVPQGWVVSSVSLDNRCELLNSAGVRFNYARIEGSGDIVSCYDTQIPKGYLIVNKTLSLDQCNLVEPRLALIIKRAPNAGSMTTCSDQRNLSLIPDDMVVNEVFVSNHCFGENARYVITYPNRVGETRICINKIPYGYDLARSEPSSEQCLNQTAWYISLSGEITPISITPFVLPEPDIGPEDIVPVMFDCGSDPDDHSFLSAGAEPGMCE